MKTTRTFASICLTASCIALFAATNVSVGDQPGVFRMASAPQENTPPAIPNGLQPVPDGNLSGQEIQQDVGQFNMNGVPSGQGAPVQNNQQQFIDPNQFLQRSAGVTSPIMGTQAFVQQPLVGPQATFEQNIDSGLGFQDSYTRINARIPNWLAPNDTVVNIDVSASLSGGGRDLYNYGLSVRHYDEARNRVWGINAFGDFDNTTSLSDYSRFGIGLESLGRYIDFIFNGYIVTGEDTFLSSRTVLPDLSLRGNNVVRSFRETRENAYSGFDAKIGGPLPWVGRRGINGYVGTYFLASEYGAAEALGVSAEVQVLATESFEVNAYYTNDEVFGTNSWVSLAYTIPNTRERQILRPRRVQDRLTDPVRRTNTIHSKTETLTATEAVINAKTGAPWTIFYVDPNATTAGAGTVESPYMTLEMALAANSAAVDAIRVIPRLDDTGINLTATGGIDLFPEQALFSSHKDFTLFTDPTGDFVIPAIPTLTDMGPLIQDPTMVAGGAVIRATDWNRIQGLRIDASDSTGTVFGMGIDGTGVEGIHVACNTFTNYTIGANILEAEDQLLFDENIFTGLAGVSTTGLNVVTRPGSTSDLRIADNTATDNSVAGINVNATPGSTINADNPLGTGTVLGSADIATGIHDNSVSGNGNGIVVTGEMGSTINAVVERNTATENTLNGFFGRVDGVGALFNLASLRDNTFTLNGENGVFLNYRNGADFRSVTEDIDGDGVLGVGEDLNGNGVLDQGIVSNTMSDNMIAGLCILGEGDPLVADSGTGGSGIFDIGGPQTALGNTFIGNLGAGIAVDLFDSATYQADTINNLITSEQVAAVNPPTITMVLDFWEASQGSMPDAFGNDLTPFDVTGFGFAATDFDLVTNAVLDQVRNYYYGIPTVGADARSPIPDGEQLAIDFVIGDFGTAPSNGATEYYYTMIGGSTSPGTPLGIAFLSAARDATGAGPNFGFVTGDMISSTYSDNINGLGGLTPADIGDDHPHEHDLAIAGDNVALQDALTSGNLTFTRNALAGTVAHEVGHTLSLQHMNFAGVVTPTGAPPIMGTGAIDLPNQQRIGVREFAYSGQNAQAGNATQMHVQQLIDALGTRSALQNGVSGAGIVVVGNDSAVVEPSTWINNEITNNGGDALSIHMKDAARAEDVTIQGNMILNNSGRGINLQATGATAFIDASMTIGGSGTNTLDGTSFTQANTITGNQLDGIRALAENGGTIYGNAINNVITQNAGNGIALLIEGGGIVDFGTPASNRLITGNTITGNGGAGILAVSTVDVTVSEAAQEMNILVQGNEISQNVSGGLIAELNGINNVPPGPPVVGFRENNVLNLTVGQTTMPFGTPVATESNLFDQNGEVGIGLSVNGTGLANVSIVGNTITNTTAGTNALFNGDGINLIRRDSSLLLADVLYNTITGNASNGLEVDTQGTNKDNQNQPMVGTVNSVTWNNNILSNNGENGASFATRGDSQLFANGMANVLTGNTLSGVLVTTSEFSSFGDPTLMGDARRSVFNGITATNNGRDGIELIATEGSQLLVEITSERIPTTTGAHAALNTMGDTSISQNGRDGIHIESGGTSLPDILITAETPVTPTSAITLISGNGTGGAGGNGIFWDSFGSVGGIVQVYNTMIVDNIAGATEDTDGDGILTFAEDTAGNFEQNQISDLSVETSGNHDIDVANGDGIQFNYFQGATSTLIVGDTGMGNYIQGNDDDGIALTGDIVRTISDGAGGSSSVSAIGFGPTPLIVIRDNDIGGVRDGLADGNGGDGVSIRSFGNTEEGVMPGDVDFSVPPADMDGLDPLGGAGAAELVGNVAEGPSPNIILDDNRITLNNRSGVNIRLNGANGLTGLRPNPIAPSLALINRITLTDNTIASNGEHGVFLRADSDMNQNRIVYLPNLDDGMGNFDNQDFSQANVIANSAFNPADLDPFLPYLNLNTVQNTIFTATGNTIQSNGTNTVVGHGIEIRVGTGAWVAADVRNNIFGGNLEEDLFTGSFLSHVDTTSGAPTQINTFESFDNTGEGTFDVVYLDDAALLDMRFTGNVGDQINPEEGGFPLISTTSNVVTELAAVYTNFDDLKFDDFDRFAGVFKIDDFFSLNAPTNVFVELGVPQSVTGEFSDFSILNLSAEAIWPEDPFSDAD